MINLADGNGIYEIAVRDLPSPPCFVAIESWKRFRKDQTAKIAIVETRNQSKGNYQFRLSAIQDRRGEDYAADAKPIAQTTSHVQLGTSETDDSGEERPVSFDFARYEIAPGQFAFGVRSEFFESFGGASNKTTHLRLFEISDREIKPILKTVMSVEGGTELNDGPIVDIESSSTISVKRIVRNGHYILSKKSGKKSADFVWSDTEKSYQLIGKDPQRTYDELARKARKQYGTTN